METLEITGRGVIEEVDALGVEEELGEADGFLVGVVDVARVIPPAIQGADELLDLLRLGDVIASEENDP